MQGKAFIRLNLVAAALMLATVTASVLAQTNLPAARDIAAGPFQPTWESLAAQYQCPEWFRDAKFGIWAVWGPQCQPEDGDWYARSMYMQGSAQNKFHVEHYGPPSKFGFKDIIPLWKGENFHPDVLLAFYKKSGAKYFLAMANHHDNFDMYDSKYQPWNSVALGPKKDIIGMWARAARKNGLRFAVSVHASHAWSWYEPAQGADQDGPLAGVPYDGKLTKADGNGLWWDGLDPQDLYAQNHTPGKKLVWDWDASKGSSVPDKAYSEKLFNRTIDLIDKYQPDLLYFDDTELPLGQAGLDIAAHLYNSNIKNHGGRLEAVLNSKGLKPAHVGAMVLDIERGRADHILPAAWQTDTCIGDWHYKRAHFENHTYKSAATVISMLADIVSKNGNLLLNIPMRGDGSIDDDEVKVLDTLASWMPANGEAIFGTRPFTVFGEGAPDVKGSGNFNENVKRPYTAEDMRFTTKGGALYAIVLAWPANGQLTIRTLAAGSSHYPKDIGRVELLGSPGALTCSRNPEGLLVTLPDRNPGDLAYALKIQAK